MEVMRDLLDFFATLTFIDYVFFFAVMILLILVISLIYFIKINEDVLEVKKEKTELELINEAIQKESHEQQVKFTNFEKEQEDKAIISYEELIGKSKNYDLNYVEETNLDGLNVKKIDLTDMYKEAEEKAIKEVIRVISYKKEEEFLTALKHLQVLLS